MKVSGGIHIISEFKKCPPELLKRKDIVSHILKKVVKEAKLNAIYSRFHQFKPMGVTGFVLLKESHISVHTWPERGYIAVDVFTCGGEGDARLAQKILEREFKPGKVLKKILKR